MTDVTRRQAIGGAATVGIGVPLLAACGGNGGGAAPVAKSGTEVAKTVDVPVGGGVVLSDQGMIVTQPSAGDFKAFSSTCTHAGCGITSVHDAAMVCPCHGSRFSIKDGSVINGPATMPLPAISITVQGGAIDKA